MIEMFFGVFLLCNPMDAGQCGPVVGPLFATEEECILDLGTNGLEYVINTYGEDVHIAAMTCVEALIEGEPA